MAVAQDATRQPFGNWRSDAVETTSRLCLRSITGNIRQGVSLNSLCDDVRVIPLQEAQRLFVAGVRKSMVSTYRQGSLPKYVWSVDDQGEAYESKLGNDGYHGYRLDKENEKTMRALVLKEWGAR